MDLVGLSQGAGKIEGAGKWGKTPQIETFQRDP